MRAIEIKYNNILVTFYMLSYIQNKNTWGVKKGQGQEEPATKSSEAKKFVNESAT